MTDRDEPDALEALAVAEAAQRALWPVVRGIADATSPHFACATLLTGVLRTVDEYDVPPRQVAAMMTRTLTELLKPTGANDA